MPKVIIALAWDQMNAEGISIEFNPPKGIYSLLYNNTCKLVEALDSISPQSSLVWPRHRAKS